MVDGTDFSVLAVSPVGEAGGAEVLLVDILVGFQAAGVTVHLIVLGEGPLTELARSRSLRTRTGPELSFRRPDSVLKCRRFVRNTVLEVRPTVVHASHPKGQLIARLSCRREPPLLTTQLYDPPFQPGMATRLAARLTGLRFAITEETASAYSQHNAALAPVVIPPGRDLSALVSQAASGNPESAWAEAGLEGEGPRIVMVARLQRFKGPIDFVAMAKLVSERIPNARFLIIGPDSPQEPHLREEVRDEIARLRLDDVVALAGWLSSPDVAATIAGSTLLVHPAAREPFGLVLVEALALGTPVVAYSSAGPSTILMDGGGVLIPSGNVHSLAAAVVEALLDTELRAAWEKQSRKIAHQFDLSTTVPRYLRIMRDAVNGESLASSRQPSTTSEAMIGVVPSGPSGVRDYGHMLVGELHRRGHEMSETWLENDGSSLGAAFLTSVRLLGLALRVPVGTAFVLHYSPFCFGYRGLPGPGVYCGAVARYRGSHTIVVLHELAYTYRSGSDGWRKRITAWSQRAALRVVLSGADSVIVATEQRRHQISSMRKRRTPPIQVLPVFSTVPVADRSVQPPSHQPFTLGVPGYAGDGVRPDLLFEALTLLEPLGPLHVLLIGAPGEYSSDGRVWRNLAIQAGVNERVRFTGVVDSAELSLRLSESDVVVLVNEEGPSSRKTTLASALAHGRPIIALDGPNRWEDLVMRGAVLVVSPSPEALAAALAKLRASPKHRVELGIRAKEYYDRNMCLASVADKFEVLIACSKAGAFSLLSSDSTECRSSQPSASQGRGATK